MREIGKKDVRVLYSGIVVDGQGSRHILEMTRDSGSAFHLWVVASLDVPVDVIKNFQAI